MDLGAGRVRVEAERQAGIKVIDSINWPIRRNRGTEVLERLKVT